MTPAAVDEQGVIWGEMTFSGTPEDLMTRYGVIIGALVDAVRVLTDEILRLRGQDDLP